MIKPSNFAGDAQTAGYSALIFNDSVANYVKTDTEIHNGWNQVEQTAINVETQRGQGIQGPKGG